MGKLGFSKTHIGFTCEEVDVGVTVFRDMFLFTGMVLHLTRSVQNTW